MDEPELTLLRTWGADLVEPPSHLEGRIKEELWQAILAEEAAAARPARRSRGWLQGMLRPIAAAGIASVLAIGVAISSGGDDVTGVTTPRSSGGVVQAGSSGLLDTAAASLFGEEAASTPAGAIRGSINLQSLDDDGRYLLAGPQVDEQTGMLTAESQEFTGALTRDPERLRDAMREAAAQVAGSTDATDRIAFHLTMRWVTSGVVPSDLRAAMVRSLAGMRGLDAVTRGTDLLGRSGLLIGHLDGLTGVRDQYLLRSSDATLVARQSFLTTQLDPACPIGTIVDYALFDDAGSALDPSAAPWLAWPPVVSACAPSSASLGA